MPAYRCFFLDSNGHIRTVSEFTSEHDWSAISEGKRLLTANSPAYSGAEVWRGPRRLWASAREDP